MAANDRQVGGDHYLTAAEADGTQHWDRMWRLYREAWFVGNITKYVERYKNKDGLKDLHKARHYLDKLIELEEAAATAATPLTPAPPGPPNKVMPPLPPSGLARECTDPKEYE